LDFFDLLYLIIISAKDEKNNQEVLVRIPEYMKIKKITSIPFTARITLGT
jgi:hypothetical protein